MKINRKGMPKDATHFTLADRDQPFTWYRHSRGHVYTYEWVASEKNWKLHFGDFQDLPEHALLVQDHHPDRAAERRCVAIDWKPMPEGATHFTLDKHDPSVTWYKHDRGHMYIYDWVESAKFWRLRFGNWQPLPEDALIVRDHHPDWVAKRDAYAIARAARAGFLAGLYSELHLPTTVWNREERADQYAKKTLKELLKYEKPRL